MNALLMTNMNISKSIARRIKLRMIPKSELQTPFIQGEHEYVTNTFFMVKMAKRADQKEDDRQLPVMKIAMDSNMPKGATVTRFDVEYLRDVLDILKSNGATHVDMQVGERSAHLKGLSSFLDARNTIEIEALIMGLSK